MPQQLQVCLLYVIGGRASQGDVLKCMSPACLAARGQHLELLWQAGPLCWCVSSENRTWLWALGQTHPTKVL
eukprot:3402160-Amphidinium_carterae.2